MKSLENVINIWQQALDLERKALEGTREQVQYEIVSLRELLQAQEDLVKKEIEFNGIYYQMKAERFRFLQITGGLTEGRFCLR
jgi:outer membrane protein TolC